MATDNWKHRSAGMKCMTCMWYVPKVVLYDKVECSPQGFMTASPTEHTELGRCRRHAPMSGGNGWPVVFEGDWCGDHKIDETKIG